MAEAVVLEHLLLREARRDELLGMLRQEHFYSDDNGWIFQAVRSLVLDGKGVDLVTVADWLRGCDRFHHVGGVDYLTMLVNQITYAYHVEQHAQIIIGKWKQRKAITVMQRAAAECYGEVGEVDGLIGGIVDELEGIQDDHAVSEPEGIGEIAQIAITELAARAAGQPHGQGALSTGLLSLDRQLGRLEPGEVTVIGARPSMGKTALARRLLTAVPAQGRAGVMFSMETKKKKLAAQWAFMMAGVNKEKLTHGVGFDAQDLQHVSEALESLRRSPLWIDDTPNLSLVQLRAKARRFKTIAARRGHQLGLIVIDYLQLMNGSDDLAPGANREQEVAKLSRGVKGLAGELDLHVVLLSQINRSVESRSVSNKRPGLADLRESGAVEADADNVLLLYRDEYYHPETRYKGIAEIIIAKQRDGRRNVTVPVGFTDWCTRFDDLRYDDQERRYAD